MVRGGEPGRADVVDGGARIGAGKEVELRGSGGGGTAVPVFGSRRESVVVVDAEVAVEIRCVSGCSEGTALTEALVGGRVEEDHIEVGWWASLLREAGAVLCPEEVPGSYS